MRFDAFRVFLGSPTSRAESGPSAAVAYVVSGSVERTPTRIHVSARLTDRPTGQVQWSRSFERSLTTADILDVRAELSSGIVSHLAQPYGIVNTAAAARLSLARPETLFAYDCVQRAFAYRRTFAKEAYPPVRACLEEAVRRDPGYADAWAMLGFAHLDAARFGFVEETAKAGEMIAGLRAAQRAVKLAPTSVRSLQSLAALRFMSGDYDGAEQIQRKAIEANPNDPESLAQLGWRLNVRGNAQEGWKYMRAAVDRSVHPPAWYYANLALAQYLAGALPQARGNAELGKGHCCGVGQFILALAEAGVGHVAGARTAYAEAVREAPILGHDPAAFMANFGVAPAVVDRIMPELRKAGLVITDLRR
jgi:tetratricopeptide (TPR) repeat protein